MLTTLAPPPLHDYQHVAVDHLRTHDRAALWLGMGLGKTASVLSALEPRHLPALVVAPKRVAEHVWPAERAKWRPDLTLIVAAGTAAWRRTVLTARQDVTVIGRDNLGDAVGGEWRTLIIDEASSVKNRSTQRWRHAMRIAKTAEYVWELTGTPSPNGLLDLWPQIALLDLGERLGKTLGGYRERYFVPSRWAYGKVVGYDIRPGAAARIHELLADICLSMESRLKLPPVTHNRIEVPLPPKIMRLYAELRQDLFTQLEDGSAIASVNAAVATGKLSQITAGFSYADPDDIIGLTTDLHDLKLDALAEVMEGTSSPVLVFYQFRHELERIQARFSQAVTIDARNGHGHDAITYWNLGKVPMLLAHPASAGHGLNLQHGGHTIVWTTPTWNAEEYAQANARLNRQGQEHPVVIHHLVCPDTVDEAILDRLDGKLSVQDALLAALRG